MIMGIGETLKETREEQNMSLDTLQEKTKIQKRYLHAIENGDFHVLPGTFYARAFIKEYAIAVGLDPDELLLAHQDEIPSTESEQSAVPYSRMQRTRKKNEPKNTAVFSFIPTVIVVLLIVAVLFVAWTLYQKSTDQPGTDDPEEQRSDSLIRTPDEQQDKTDDEEKDENNENDETNESEEDEEEPEVDESEEHTWEVTETGSGNRPESTMTFTSGTSDVEISIATEDETWLSVKDDTGSISIEQLLQSADSPLVFDVSDVEQLYISLGNASNVTITMNDEEMEFPVDPKQFVVQKYWIDIEKPE